MDAAAKKLGLRVVSLDISTPDEFESAFSRITGEAALMLLDGMFFAHRRRIAELAVKRRLPLMTAERSYAEEGFLLTHGPSFDETLRLVAVYVDKILRGAKPGDLPIDQPSKLDLVINLKTAKALGLTIPPSVMLRADRVIE